MPRPFAPSITLSADDRATLTAWARRPKTAQALALRARIILAAAELGVTNGAIAVRLGVTRPTVTKWRGRFAARGLDGLHDDPRPGATRTITDTHIEQVITTTLEATPVDATHWSTRRLARQLGMSQSAITRIWHAFGLAPHKLETFKLSRDPLFIDKVRDVVGLYLNPPDRALVLCVDEKPQIQATEGTTPVLPLRPGQPEQHSHDDIRHGTRDLFAALDVKAGTVIGELHHRHRSVEFRQFLDTVDAHMPPALDLHLILDNSSIHKTPLIQRWLVRHSRVYLHCTPTSASWLNLVECWFALLTTRRLVRGAFRSTWALEHAIKQYIAAGNTDPRPFVWTKTADDILASVARYCQRTTDSHH
jgi:transposase